MEFSFLGFKVFDFALLAVCTWGAVMGSVVQGMIATINPDGPPNTMDELRKAPPEMQEVRAGWFHMRVFIGGVAGFIFALYFVGMLNESASTFARIWALSFVVGYAAPKIWATKSERLVSQLQSEAEPVDRA